MRAAVLGLVACAALAACATPTTLTPSAQVAVADTGTSIDATYNAAAQAYLAVAPTLPAATKVTIKADFKTAFAYVQAADKAAALGDATTLAAQTALLMPLIAQIQALLPAKGS